MLTFLRRLLKSLPTLLIALALSISAWLAAVSSTDPNEIHTYAHPVTIEFRGQAADLVVSGGETRQVTVTFNAPRSVWQQLNSSADLVHAYVDLAALPAGTHSLPVQVFVDARPVRVMLTTPATLDFALEPLVADIFPIQLVTRGEPAVGYQAEAASLDPLNASISGPQSLVAQVVRVRASVDLTQTRENITASLPLSAVDINGNAVDGLVISPAAVQVIQPITQKGGYRNVVVKVVSQGNLANGYRLTNITVQPPNLTVFSEDPGIVETLPGYIETLPIPLQNIKTDAALPADLNLPAGISVVGNQVVMVTINVEPVESSLTISRVPVLVTGLADKLQASLSPQSVDVLLSGPLPLLDVLRTQEIQVTLDLTGKGEGTYQLAPNVLINTPEIRVESVIPGNIQVIVTRK
jgi:YbbR domain-containing protein